MEYLRVGVELGDILLFAVEFYFAEEIIQIARLEFLYFFDGNFEFEGLRSTSEQRVGVDNNRVRHNIHKLSEIVQFVNVRVVPGEVYSVKEAQRNLVGARSRLGEHRIAVHDVNILIYVVGNDYAVLVSEIVSLFVGKAVSRIPILDFERLLRARILGLSFFKRRQRKPYNGLLSEVVFTELDKRRALDGNAYLEARLHAEFYAVGDTVDDILFRDGRLILVVRVVNYILEQVANVLGKVFENFVKYGRLLSVLVPAGDFDYKLSAIYNRFLLGEN